MVKKVFGIASMAFVITAVGYGCSSSTDTSTDAGTDGGKLPPKEAGTDAGGDTCKPGDVSGFTGGLWKPPAGKMQAKCTAEQVSVFYKCIFTQAGNSAPECKQFEQGGAGEDCIKCGLTPPTADALGPGIIEGSSVRLNTAGCMALATGDNSANGCGATIQKSLNCQTEACDANCPRPQGDEAALTKFQECTQAAAQGVCADFANNINSACPQDAGSEANQYCVGGSSFEDRIGKYVDYFCGGKAGDGGDASTD